MFRLPALLFLLATALPIAAVAAEIRLTILDPAGRVIPSATLTPVGDGADTIPARRVDGAIVFDLDTPAQVIVEAHGFLPEVIQLQPGIAELSVTLEQAALMEELTVDATRSRIPLAELSSSVTTIEREQLSEQLLTSPNLGDALGKLVPGLAPGNGSATIWGQSLRGRGMQILVDGIPLTTLRNTARDLVSIDPTAIERIEVLRGTAALYGDGATGGMVNIITRSNERKPVSMHTTISTSSSLTEAGDSLGGRILQSLGGSSGRFDWRVDLSAEQTGAFFDADGDRLPADPHGQGGPAETRTYSGLVKTGFTFDEDRRLQFMALRLDSLQDTEWTSDPTVNALPPLSVKSRAIRGLDLDHPQGSENTLLQLSWQDDSVFGSSLRSQVWARDYQTTFVPFDGRPYAAYGHKIFQSRLESSSLGARLDFETPLPVSGLTAYWGFDAGSEETQQPVWIMDPDLYDASQGRQFRTVDDRPWVPLIDKQNHAAFAQLEWLATAKWLLRGGFRSERITADIPSFVTLAEDQIPGGSLDVSDTLFNAGVVYYATSSARLFASYSEGFSLPDIGLVLRSAPAGASIESLPFQPQVVEAWELGTALERGGVSSTLAVFYNTSEFGTSAAGFNQPVIRAPERIYGVEGSVEYRGAGPYSFGLTGAWSEGEYDPDLDGEYTYLNQYRIAPPNATAWVEHETRSWWTNRLQVLWSGERDRFDSTAFGLRPLESYTVVDWSSSFRLPTGRLNVGVENLLNELYYTRDAQLLRSGSNNSHTPARGATLTVGWSIDY